MSLRRLVVLGAGFGVAGCVSGALDEQTLSGGNNAGNSSSGAQLTASGSGGASASGGNAHVTAGGPAGGNQASSGSGNTTPNGGTGPDGAGSGNGGTGTSGSTGSSGSLNNGGGPAVTPKDCKRGLGWHGNALTDSEVTSKLTWWYTWGTGVQSVGAGLEFVPMIWGGGAKAADVSKSIRSDAQYLLGYNEPNFFEQANLSAQQAAADWPTVQSVATTHQLQTVSPAVNFCGDDQTGAGPCHDTNPVGYLTDFFAACQGCKVDYIAVHWYNCDGASLEWYLDQFKQFNRPIWLTELACAYDGDTSIAGQEKYMREAIPILEGRADVYRYAWFSGDPMPNARLLNADGSLTALGKIYVDLPHDPTCTP